MTETKPSYQVLARKYRPGQLSELIGQDMLVRTITNAIESDRIPHAFILTGIRGVGKTSSARIIARSLVCTGVDNNLDKPTITPCGECEQCKAIASDRHVDILEMDAASRTGVGDIREIIENVNYLPVMARYKIYIIDEVHMLSKSAFNALLKTLEEPPKHTKFIFATTEIRKIPITILSRCMRFDLPRVDSETLSKHLAGISVKEGVKVEDEALTLIAHSTEGSVRDALSLLDQAIGSSEDGAEITYDNVRQMLGVACRERIFDLFEAILGGNPADAMSLLRELYHDGADPVTLLNDLLELSHFITQIKVIPSLADGKHIAQTDRGRGKSLAEKLSLPFLARMWQMLLKGISEVKIASNGLIAAEMVIIRIAYSSDLPTPSDLVKDIKSGGNASSAKITSSPELHSNSRAISSDNTEIPLESARADSGNDVNPINFSQLIELFEKKGENFIAGWLKEVSLVSFDVERCKLEFCPSGSSPSSLAGDVGNFLSQWTGNRWIAIVSNENGGKSISQEKDDDFEKRRKLALEDKNVKAFLDAFPGSRVSNISELHDDEPESEIHVNINSK